MIGLPPRDRARLTEWMVGHLGVLCPPWLVTQRWFGGKSRPIAGATIVDVIWLETGLPSCALVLVDVRYADDEERGEPVDRYALVVGVARQASPALIASVPGTPWMLIEAATHPDAVAAVLEAMRQGVVLTGAGGGELCFDGGTAIASGDAEVTTIGQEQSNTSMRIGQRHVFKLIRRVQAGQHPQLEIGAFLTSAGFGWSPPLEGSMTYRDGRGRAHAVGVLEGWMENVGDGWRYVTSCLALGSATAERESLLDALGRLGAITADLHVVLASDRSTPAFAPEPVAPGELTAWRDQVLREEARVLDIVAHDRIGWVEPAYGLSRTALAGRERLQRLIRSLKVDAVGGISKIRVHGDYHLGQTLKTAGGFVLIDFEGEPARPLADRRRKHCALKDVAGMLRSLDYADAAVRMEMPSALSLVSRMRHAFLEGYYSRPELRAILPAHEASGSLLMLFELEKVLYEIDYELNNRPDWLPIPLGALARIIDVSP